MSDVNRHVVKIESLSSQGAGIARLGDLVVFVDQTVPEETVEIEIIEHKKNFARGKVVRIIAPGVSRITAPCPVAEECGGCQWQHIEYAEQLRQKSRIVRDALQRIGGVVLPGPVEIEPSPREFRYRNRIQVHVQNQKIGYFAAKSHDLIAIEDCLIAEEALVKEFPAVIKSAPQDRNSYRYEIKMSQDEGVSFQNRDLGFSQVNRYQIANLVNYVVQLSARYQVKTIYDFFCGSGNFAFPLREKFPEAVVTGIDLNEPAIIHANQIASHDAKMKFVLADCENYLRREKIPNKSLVILDPPRIGCSEEFMHELSGKHQGPIIYVSCNPATLSRDVKNLMRVRSGWRVLSVRAFDMFPQTAHVETVVLVDADGA